MDDTSLRRTKRKPFPEKGMRDVVARQYIMQMAQC